MNIIKNFGFLWEKKYLYLGTGGAGKSGHLKGSNTKKKSEIIDFREQIGVYALYDKNQNIVYVGQAGNGGADLHSRLKQHTRDFLWNRWEYFTWVGFRDVNNNGSLTERHKANASITGYSYADALNEIEGILIEIIEPKLNKQSGKLNSANEFFQFIDDNLKELTTNELYKKIAKDQIDN